MSERIVVVGGGLAAGTVVDQLREGGYDGPVSVYTDEHHPPYERPPLSKDLLLGKGKPDDALVNDAGWYADHDVELHTGTRVTSLDLGAKDVVADGERVGYDRLVLATGSRPRR
ncbi:MAG: FAD-dependent oxidoreductase, partial [Marmoricola sp.]|nr:FAD-dependent oxidoreductase [Marmoricola sp.]